jgi:hypothetical protein
MPKESKTTSVKLPLDLWIRVKKAAIDQDTDLRNLIIEALELYLKSNEKGGMKRK